ncbi:unnamed protein product, partial [Ectocarpus sp. 12 AP-2014]
VDLVVEVRSSEGNILYTGPTLKVRTCVRAEDILRQHCRDTRSL